jgi:hypothetical protein
MKNKTILALILTFACLPAESRAEDDNRWHLDASFNLFMAGLSGNLAVAGQPADVDAGFGDIMDNLEFAAAGRVTVGYERWLLSTEFSYMGLGASKNGVSADLDQWLVEPTIGYQFCNAFQLFAGVRYNNIRADLSGPFGNLRSNTKDWWDPIVGAQVCLPLVKDQLTFAGRFDVGGFDVGSDLTWQAFPYLDWRIAKSTSLQLGYRWLATDYETGSGASLFRYDVIVQGPQIGLTFHF